MTEHTFTIDSFEQVAQDDGSFQWAAYATADDGTGVMGYGDTKVAAAADVAHAVEVAFAGDTTVELPETNPDAVPVDLMSPDWTFALSLGSGALGASHDLLIAA